MPPLPPDAPAVRRRVPLSPFPDKPHFRPIIQTYQREPVTFVAKSRDLMLSWLTVGYLTHVCMLAAPEVQRSPMELFSKPLSKPLAQFIVGERGRTTVLDSGPLAQPLSCN
jgi:hypothetical protein